MKVKICGVTTLDDASMVTEAGADLIGLNFYKQSPRYIEPEAAGAITDALREHFGEKVPVFVGVFVNAPVSEISQIMEIAGLDFAQLSGDESDDVLHELRGRGFKAIRPPNKALALDDAGYYSKEFINDPRIPSLLLDAYHPKLYGGTGETASVEVALAVKGMVPRLMLAGGLNPANIGERVAAIRPWGVDVASGVEPEGQPGVKDPDKVRQFVGAAKAV
jgi:phosphoribosylanthranilate isomerase